MPGDFARRDTRNGVCRRTDFALWQFAVSVPKDLLPGFEGMQWATRCSLGTADLRQANDKARALHAEWTARFAAMRSGISPRVNPVPLRTQFLDHLAGQFDRWEALVAGWPRDKRRQALAEQRADLARSKHVRRVARARVG